MTTDYDAIAALTDPRERIHAALDCALDDDRGGVIVALYDRVPEADLERLVDAVQLIDSECADLFDALAEWRKPRAVSRSGEEQA